jgi:hypothetical protein
MTVGYMNLQDHTLKGLEYKSVRIVEFSASGRLLDICSGANRIGSANGL